VTSELHSGYDSSVEANAVIKSLSRQIAEMAERIAMLEAIIEVQLGDNANDL
jgi:hypothetical protein